METNLLCKVTGERCWNVQALQRHADAMTQHETVFAEQHEGVTVQPGEIGCEGVVENIYGLGRVCLPFMEPSLVVYQDVVLELSANARRLRDIKGFRLIKPDGSFFDHLINKAKC